MRNCNWLIKVFVVLVCWCGSFFSYAGERKAFIIDTDGFRDDVIAMLYLLKIPDISVKAITIEANENAHCQAAFHTTLGVLHLIGLKNVPVACGIDKPANGTSVLPNSMLTKEDNFLSSTAGLLPRSTMPVNYGGAKLLVKTIRASKAPVTIVAIGQLTNIAEAYQLDPGIKNHINKIYVMGGAVHVPGNMDGPEQHKAEWNLHFDPAATAVVLANFPVVLVPLDATNAAPMNEAFLQRVMGDKRNIAYEYFYQILKNGIVSLRSGLWFFWDPMAAVVATDESVCEFKFEKLRVVEKPETGSQLGATVVDGRKGSLIKVCEKVKVREFENKLLAVINS